MKNEDALLQNGINIDTDKNNKEINSPWKLVTLGGVAGILMGAGSLYGGQMVAKNLESDETTEENFDAQIKEDGVKVAEVEQDLSFGQAFAAARAEVGPGGVFYWHGGIYNTYYAEEWNSMTHIEKNDFAQRVQPEIRPNELSTPTDANTHVVVVHHVYHTEEVRQTEPKTEDVTVVDHHANESDVQDGDVHIVGFANVQGHIAVGVDMNSDGMADVAIIDVDDNLEISNPDLIIDRNGNMATVGEIVNSNQPNLESTNGSLDIPDDTSAETSYPLYDI
jgi:hypothetical protein